MGREIRRVPAGWQHPIRDDGEWPADGSFPRGARFKAMFEASRPYIDDLKEYVAAYEAWEAGTHEDRRDDDGNMRPYDYREWAGGPPDPRDHMPYWPDEQRTHYQMYEDTSEGTPISPVFATPEEVARWCADNGVSIFGGETADYETWLRIASGGAALGLIADSAGLRPLVVGPSGNGAAKP